MTTMQIASLVAVAAVAVYFYMPPISLPRRPRTLQQIRAVLEIRDTNPSPEVRKACSSLLQALLQ